MLSSNQQRVFSSCSGQKQPSRFSLSDLSESHYNHLEPKHEEKCTASHYLGYVCLSGVKPSEAKSLRRQLPGITKSNAKFTSTTLLNASATASAPHADVDDKPFAPSWKDILEVPISIDTKEKFDYLLRAKRIRDCGSKFRPSFDVVVVFGSLDFARRHLIGHGNR
jgi:hypothetical protein